MQGRHDDTVRRIEQKMRYGGITATYLASHLVVSRQYVWQILHRRAHISDGRARAIEEAVDGILAERKHLRTFGDRLRAARIAAGLTLKQAARHIGYTWVGVERWEKDRCRPRPQALRELCTLYCGGNARSTASRQSTHLPVDLRGEVLAEVRAIPISVASYPSSQRRRTRSHRAD